MPADHVRSPLRHSHPRNQTPAAVPEPVPGDFLARADEVRRPIDEARLASERRDRIRREALRASHVDAVRLETRSGFEPPDAETRAMLPRGRNFQ